MPPPPLLLPACSLACPPATAVAVVPQQAGSAVCVPHLHGRHQGPEERHPVQARQRSRQRGGGGLWCMAGACACPEARPASQAGGWGAHLQLVPLPLLSPLACAACLSPALPCPTVEVQQLDRRAACRQPAAGAVRVSRGPPQHAGGVAAAEARHAALRLQPQAAGAGGDWRQQGGNYLGEALHRPPQPDSRGGLLRWVAEGLVGGWARR